MSTEGERLRALLGSHYEHRHGWVTKLAEASGVKRGTLHSWFNGAAQPDFSSLVAVGQAVGLNAYELVAAMEGKAPVVELNEQVRAAIRQEIEAALDERAQPAAPRGQSDAA
jgi:DNA-binding phage protein